MRNAGRNSWIGSIDRPLLCCAGKATMKIMLRFCPNGDRFARGRGSRLDAFYFGSRAVESVRGLETLTEFERLRCASEDVAAAKVLALVWEDHEFVATRPRIEDW